MKSKNSKKNFKCLYTALCLTLAFTLCNISSVFADENVFAGGDGTVNNPYQIETFDQLKELSAGVKSGTYVTDSFVLVQDIDCQGAEFEPIGCIDVTYSQGNYTIGTINRPFKGTFNGNGHVIKNIKITAPQSGVGFFGVTEGAKVSDLGIENITHTFSNVRRTAEKHVWGAGGMVGVAEHGSSFSRCYVKNVSIENKSSNQEENAAGFCGASLYFASNNSNASKEDPVTFEDCYVNNLSVTTVTTGTNNCHAGFFGVNREKYFTYVKMTNCYVGGKVESEYSKTDDKTGKFVAFARLKKTSTNITYGEVENCLSVATDNNSAESNIIVGNAKATKDSINTAFTSLPSFKSDSNNINDGYPILVWQNNAQPSTPNEIYESYGVAAIKSAETITGIALTRTREVSENAIMFVCEFDVDGSFKNCEIVNINAGDTNLNESKIYELKRSIPEATNRTVKAFIFTSDLVPLSDSTPL